MCYLYAVLIKRVIAKLYYKKREIAGPDKVNAIIDAIAAEYPTI